MATKAARRKPGTRRDPLVVTTPREVTVTRVDRMADEPPTAAKRQAAAGVAGRAGPPLRQHLPHWPRRLRGPRRPAARPRSTCTRISRQARPTRSGPATRSGSTCRTASATRSAKSTQDLPGHQDVSRRDGTEPRHPVLGWRRAVGERHRGQQPHPSQPGDGATRGTRPLGRPLHPLLHPGRPARAGGPHGVCMFPQPGRYSLGHTGNFR